MGPFYPIIFALGVCAVAQPAFGLSGMPRTHQPLPAEQRPEPVPHEKYDGSPWIRVAVDVPANIKVRCAPVEYNEFVSVQVNVDGNGCNIPGDAANEPSIAVDPTDPNKMVIGWRQFDSIHNGRIDLLWYDTHGGDSELSHTFSFDAGRTWSVPATISPPFDRIFGYPGGQAKLGDYITARSDNFSMMVAMPLRSTTSKMFTLFAFQSTATRTASSTKRNYSTSHHWTAMATTSSIRANRTRTRTVLRTCATGTLMMTAYWNHSICARLVLSDTPYRRTGGCSAIRTGTVPLTWTTYPGWSFV